MRLTRLSHQRYQASYILLDGIINSAKLKRDTERRRFLFYKIALYHFLTRRTYYLRIMDIRTFLLSGKLTLFYISLKIVKILIDIIQFPNKIPRSR